jgi:hypothetical protein
MKNFEIYNTAGNEYDKLIVLTSFEAPLVYKRDYENSLLSIGYKGLVLIDQLLHCGNTDERFIKAEFDGLHFVKGSFEFVKISHKSHLRKFICDLLTSDSSFIEMTILNDVQKNLILNGIAI